MPQLSNPTTEEGRAFLQMRVGLFGKWMFGPAFAFVVVSYVPASFAGKLDLNLTFAAHMIGTLLLLAIWIACRRYTLSTAALRFIEGPGAAIISIAWVVMGVGMSWGLAASKLPGVSAFGATFTVLLAVSYTLLVRAIAVPSTPLRTLFVGVIGATPVIALAVFLMNAAGVFKPAAIFGGAVSTTVWIVAAIAVSSATSNVIFGLRREVERNRQLGQYTLEAEIGAGGMGVVYRARHAMLRRPTAVKVLSPDKAGTESIKRFEREVQLTASLSHANTVSIYDYGRTPDGLFYYAMEYLDGIDLEQLVNEHGPLEPARVIAILDKVCGSLAEAHDVGLIHRDIKPANIVLAPRGGEFDVVKVLDFGLVKEIDGGAADVALSAANVLVGTPAYLSPEAIRGDDIDHRADIYAVGAVGYWLITGHLLFEANTLVEMCSHHLHSAPVPAAERLGSDVPSDLSLILERCLEKEPERRYADARDLREALIGCDAAGGWSAADAASWWREHQSPPTRETRTTTVPTLAIDLDARLVV